MIDSVCLLITLKIDSLFSEEHQIEANSYIKLNQALNPSRGILEGWGVCTCPKDKCNCFPSDYIQRNSSGSQNLFVPVSSMCKLQIAVFFF